MMRGWKLKQLIKFSNNKARVTMLKPTEVPLLISKVKQALHQPIKLRKILKKALQLQVEQRLIMITNKLKLVILLIRIRQVHSVHNLLELMSQVLKIKINKSFKAKLVTISTTLKFLPLLLYQRIKTAQQLIGPEVS